MLNKELIEIENQFLLAVNKVINKLIEAKPTTSLKFIGKEPKSPADLVAESILIDSLSPIGIPIFSEEAGQLNGNHENDYLILIDPLDGTINFERGNPTWAVSICLLQKKKPILGVIYSNLNKSIYSGIANIGSKRNGNGIKTSLLSNKKQSIIASGFPSSFNFDEETLKQQLLYFKDFAKVRMIGSAATSLCLVADGTFDCYYEQRIKPWDVAAGMVICTSAGGSCNIDAFEDVKKPMDLLVSNGLLSIF